MRKPRRMKTFEGSPADNALDRAGARKAGMSMSQWEGSPQDAAMDAAAQKGNPMAHGGQVVHKRGPHDGVTTQFHAHGHLIQHAPSKGYASGGKVDVRGAGAAVRGKGYSLT